MEDIKIIDVNPGNVLEHSLFCVKDIKNPAFVGKQNWFQKRHKEGLRMKILKGQGGRLIAFIEYLPAEFAWRPVNADNYMFIHCMFVYSNADKKKGYATMLINACEEDARLRNMYGTTVMTSKGTWITDRRVFEKTGFTEVDKKERFELMAKKIHSGAPDPGLIDWTANRKRFKGWHLLYADQCPWHDKSAGMLKETAVEYGFDLKITKIKSAREAKQAPSGFGVFNLLHDGKLLEDHYISKARFRNIIHKELNI